MSSHNAAYTETDGIRHVRLIPFKPITSRIVILGGVHGNEFAGRLAVPKIVVACSEGIGIPCLEQTELVLVPEAHPEACSLGYRVGSGGGDLNCSWPGTDDPRTLSFTSCKSRDIAKTLTNFILLLQPNLIIGLHSQMNAPIIYGSHLTEGLAKALNLRHEILNTDAGLAAWGARIGVPAFDLEVNEWENLEDAVKMQTRLVLSSIIKFVEMS